jgi:hypothetical protein
MSSTEASARCSADLRAEIGAIAADLDACEGKVILFDQKISELALLVYRKDPTAQGRVVQCRDLKAKVHDEIRLLSDAKAAAEVHLKAALEREEVGRKQAAAVEAEGFADQIAPIGARLDDLLSEFKREYLKMKSGLSAANIAGHGPTAEQVNAACAQAFFWAMSDRHAFMEFQLAPPAPIEGRSLRPNFSRLTQAWGQSAKGAAIRLLAPPVVHGPNGAAKVAAALSLNGSGKLLPKVTDVGEKFADDPSNFSIR